LALAVLGATLTPWLQFYLQSAVVERRAQLQSYNLLRLEVMLGTGAALLVAYFIILASATTIHLSGVRLYEVKDAAQALGPLLGGGAGWYFGLFLFMVSFLGLAMVPLSTAYAFCRAFGLENGTNKKFNEAPVFFIIFTALLAGSAVFVLLFRGVFLQLMVAAQVMNGLLVPFMLVFMLRLTNNKKLMGHSANSTFYNVIVGGLIGFSFVLVLMLLIYTFG
jgi:Mn2+/Fe2+ NRAMP family transporter